MTTPSSNTNASANIIEAADGRIFNAKNLAEATMLIFHSILRNFTFNLVTTLTAKKIRSILNLNINI